MLPIPSISPQYFIKIKAIIQSFELGKNQPQLCCDFWFVKVFVEKIYWLKKFGPKIFIVQKYFNEENNLTKKIAVHKSFLNRNCGPKN